MAKGIYIGVDSKARKVTKAYVVADGLTVNGAFNNGLEGWTVQREDYTASDVIQENGENVLRITTTKTGQNQIAGVMQQLPSVNATHIYYLCAYIKFEPGVEGSEATTICGVNFNTLWQLGGRNITSNWTFYSKRITINSSYSFNTINVGIYLQSLNDVAYFKNVKLYDLTEMFGAGNEPTVAWCDANLETLKLRKVKKGYIGVDGVARLFYKGTEPQTITNFATPSFSSSTYIDEFGGEWKIDPPDSYKAWNDNADDYYTGSVSSITRLTLTLPEGYYLTPKKFWYTIRYCGWELYGVSSDGTEYRIATGANGSTGTVDSSFDIKTDNQREYVKFYLDIYSYNDLKAPQMKEAMFSDSVLRIE